MLTSLRHWAVSCGYDENRAVHLCSTRDHVLNVVGVTWAVYVCVVTSSGLVLNVGRRDCDTALALFWSFVDLVVCDCVTTAILFVNTVVIAAVKVVLPWST